MLNWRPPIGKLHNLTKDLWKNALKCLCVPRNSIKVDTSTATPGTTSFVLCKAFFDKHHNLILNCVPLLSSSFPPFMTAGHHVSTFALGSPSLLSLIDNCVNIFWVKSDWSVYPLPSCSHRSIMHHSPELFNQILFLSFLSVYLNSYQLVHF